jgi:hypothetical protein
MPIRFTMSSFILGKPPKSSVTTARSQRVASREAKKEEAKASVQSIPLGEFVPLPMEIEDNLSQDVEMEEVSSFRWEWYQSLSKIAILSFSSRPSIEWRLKILTTRISTIPRWLWNMSIIFTPICVIWSRNMQSDKSIYCVSEVSPFQH